MRKIILSSLLIDLNSVYSNSIISSWALNKNNIKSLTEKSLSNVVFPSRVVTHEKYLRESEYCLMLYTKYVEILANELNKIHNCEYSIRYWETLLNSFLYPLISSLIDKLENLELLKCKYPDACIDIINPRSEFISAHSIPSFGSSKMLHLLMFSILVKRFQKFSYNVVDDAFIKNSVKLHGDGKKSIKKKKSKVHQLKLNLFKRFYLPYIVKNNHLKLKNKNPKIVSLGNQYLDKNDFDYLMKQINVSYVNFIGFEDEIPGLSTVNKDLRRIFDFPDTDSVLEKSIQDAILIILPTIFLEDYSKFNRSVRKVLPKESPLILNSMNHGKGHFIDFLIAHLVEERKAKHIMICHGGNYGIMEVSIQEKIWARIADTYVLWSNTKIYNEKCDVIKLPSLRFHKHQNAFAFNYAASHDVLILISGHYPERYVYNSIFPNTIDESYEGWQIRFLNNVNKETISSIVIRDYHNFNALSNGLIEEWAQKNRVRIDSSNNLESALKKSKISIHTAPQTSYLEALTANHPSICYWNPDSNIIRKELIPYFTILEDVGILHKTPESAAKKLNEVAFNPSEWWNSGPIQESLEIFKHNVCFTHSAALDQWSLFIQKKLSNEG